MKRHFLASLASKILLLIIIAVMTAGCANPQMQGTEPGAGSGTLPGENVFPLVKNTISLKILKPFLRGDTAYGKTDVIREYEEKTNVKIEWIIPPADEFNDRYSLIMASGDLPDMIISCPRDDIEKRGQQGDFIALNGLIDEYMPNLKRALAEYPKAKKIVTSNDGMIYSMPFIYRHKSGNNILMIREDWLGKLGLSMPVTTDEWYEVLKAFKTQDPNGNGIEDEIPYSGIGIQDLCSLVSAWGLHDEKLEDVTSGSRDEFYLAEKLHPQDGKIHFSSIEPRYKEALEWFAMLYREGLVDEEIMTNSAEAFVMKMKQNLVGSTRGYFGGDLSTLNRVVPDNGVKEFHMIGAPVLKGPYGDQWHTFVDQAALPQGMVITRRNKYPAVTARWADYWYGPEGQSRMYGYEGKHYVIKDGIPQWTDYVIKNPEGKSSPEVWGASSPGRSIWPTVWLPEELILQGDSPEAREAKERVLKPEYLIEPLPPGLSFSQKENERRNQIMADIRPYVYDSTIKFIIGQKPFSEWDDYVSHVKSLGIVEVLDIYQEAYLKWQKK